MNTSRASDVRTYGALSLLANRELLAYCEIARYNRLIKGLHVELEKIAEWRRKVTDRSITPDEYREAIAYLRQGRASAAPQPKPPKQPRAKRAKQGKIAPTSQVDLEDLIRQVETL